MANQSEFDGKLKSILNKYKTAIQSRDQKFLNQYLLHCLDRDIVVSPKSYGHNTKPSCKRKVFTYILKILLLISLGIVSVLYAKHRIDTAELDPYSKDSTYWLYFYRKWAVQLGLNKLTFIKRLYDQDCAINNPFYKEPGRQCECGFNLRRYKLDSPEKAQKSFMRKIKSNNINPFIMKGAANPVPYTTLRSLMLQASEDMSSGHSFITRLSGSSVSSDYKYLFADSEEPPRHQNLHWSMSFVGAAHHMRGLFPRPSFVPMSQEVHISRSVFTFGSQAPSASEKLSYEAFDGTFYIQAWGRQSYMLKSDPTCKCKGESVAFELEQGDIIYYSGNIHDLYTSTSTNRTGYSMGYGGSITTEVAKKVSV